MSDSAFAVECAHPWSGECNENILVLIHDDFLKVGGIDLDSSRGRWGLYL